MEKDTLIEELNLLWEPVQPYLARQIEELYGRRDGQILEIGPFSGLIFALAQKKVGRSFLIAAFPQAAVRSCRQEARRLGLEDRIRIIESDTSLVGITDESVDLTIFRGALFFPSLFQVDFGAITRTLKKGGIAFVGGGFGKYTPPEVIRQIGKRSEQLNLAMGKVRVTVESVQEKVRSGNPKGKFEITTAGGLWVVMKK
jgi:predicted O-methyltransferase YrrM